MQSYDRITNLRLSLFLSINHVSIKRHCCCEYNVTIFYSNVKRGLFWTIDEKYSKNDNWKKDYNYVILSIIPEQGTYQSPEFYAQAWVQKQSQDFDNHYSWVWDWNWAQNSILSMSLSLRFISNHHPLILTKRANMTFTKENKSAMWHCSHHIPICKKNWFWMSKKLS